MVQEYALAIGWTESTWGDLNDMPSTYNQFWDELTDAQRGNATELCYFEEIWNEEKLQFWTTGPPTDSPTLAPSMSMAPPTAAPTVAATESVTDDSSASVIAQSLLLGVSVVVMTLIL